eukprot:8015718-Pyramimonas_sp.AAC.1
MRKRDCCIHCEEPPRESAIWECTARKYHAGAVVVVVVVRGPGAQLVDTSLPLETTRVRALE